MKIGVIGSGAVGRVLATAFLKEGHQVTLGSRNPNKDEVVKWLAENPGGQAGDFAATASFGELLVLATKGSVTMNAIELAGKQNLAGKVIIDATNPIAEKPPVNGVLSFFTTIEESFMEQLQKAVPEAKFVKAFNSVGNALMYKPELQGQKPTMFICGNDAGAKQKVAEILERFGWESEDMGTVEAARAIEPLCILWCITGFLKNDWMHAFKLLKK
ncbi:MAG: NAD(P)-binding domain-containing protein [Bacteroidetes bacterium]|nr:NAD(P)-binding domain-containing protein [Bacteroidota bacterium]